MIRRLMLLAGVAAGVAVPLLMAPLSAVGPRVSRARAVDLSSTLTIQDGECSFSPQIDAALERMLTGTAGGDLVPRQVSVGQMRLRSRVVRTAPTPPGGTGSFDAVAVLPGPAVWTGLPVEALIVGTGIESSYQGLRFRASPQAVQRALRRLGIRAPLPPDLLDLPVDQCSASLRIDRTARGAELTCGSGC